MEEIIQQLNLADETSEGALQFGARETVLHLAVERLNLIAEQVEADLPRALDIRHVPAKCTVIRDRPCGFSSLPSRCDSLKSGKNLLERLTRPTAERILVIEGEHPCRR